MIELKKLQKEIYQNKKAKKFNIKDINLEFCLIHEELAEAQQAYRKKLPDLGEAPFNKPKKDFRENFQCMAVIDEIVLSIVKEITPEESKNPDNLRVFKL